MGGVRGWAKQGTHGDSVHHDIGPIGRIGPIRSLAARAPFVPGMSARPRTTPLLAPRF
jgi:hypothetical protein